MSPAHSLLDDKTTHKLPGFPSSMKAALLFRACLYVFLFSRPPKNDFATLKGTASLATAALRARRSGNPCEVATTLEVVRQFQTPAMLSRTAPKPDAWTWSSHCLCTISSQTAWDRIASKADR